MAACGHFEDSGLRAARAPDLGPLPLVALMRPLRILCEQERGQHRQHSTNSHRVNASPNSIAVDLNQFSSPGLIQYVPDSIRLERSVDGPQHAAASLPHVTLLLAALDQLLQRPHDLAIHVAID